MPLILKDLEELEKLQIGAFGLDPRKHYLIVTEDVKLPEYIRLMEDVFKRKGLNVTILMGVDPEKWHIFEMEHKL